MKDTGLHKLYNIFNSKPRNAISDAVRDTEDYNYTLEADHIITTPESSRSDITKIQFDFMTKIESVMAKSRLESYLTKNYLKQNTKLLETKGRWENLRAHLTKEETEEINEIIGG